MESGAIKRRLTAILAADAVNYSRHMGEDEEGTLRQLAAHRAVIDRIIEAHEGRIVGTAGDSVLAEFASPVEAVRCAVEIQEGVHTRNETLPMAQRLDFRIGVNLGDVMIDGEDILGDGVNVAARLESIAEPGGICISSSVYDQVAGKLSLGFVDLGERSLKNIARPIRVYQFDRKGATGGAARAGRARRTTAAIVAGIVALALAAAGVWQSGWFGRSAEQKAVAPPPAAVASAPPAEASPEMKLKLQIAEAERAKAEAELAKSRSEAEAAKQRAEAEGARQRAAARAPAADSRAATAPPAAAHPPPSAPYSSAPPTSASVAPLPPPAASPPPAIIAAAPLAAPAAAVPAVAALDAAAVKGIATRDCAATDDQKEFSDRRLPVHVDSGEIVVERGSKGQPGYMVLRGKPSPDGNLTLVGTAISMGKRNYGKDMAVYFAGAYADGAYALTGRTGGRTCTMTLRMAKP